MTGNHSTLRRSQKNRVSTLLSMTLGIVGILLLPPAVKAQTESAQTETAQIEIDPEILTWARVDFLRNRVQLVPADERGRRARISDVLSVGDSLRTARASRAELRFNDGSLARVGERATFRFTPNTRNFQLSNGTILLLIPPGRGRSTIQTPNAVTGIQGSALFVRYIPETDTTIVGALTNNPNGPMVLFNRDGTEQQALRANEIGVIQGDQITELYQFDGTLFWQSSGLAEGFNYLSDSSSTGSDALDGVRQEIRDAISGQQPISSDSAIVNPETFSRPAAETGPGAETGAETPVDGTGTIPGEGSVAPDANPDANPDADLDAIELEDADGPTLEFQNSPAQDYLQGSTDALDADNLGVGVNNQLAPSTNATTDQGTTGASAGSGPDTPTQATGDSPEDGTSDPTPIIVTDDDDGMANPTIASPSNPRTQPEENNNDSPGRRPPSSALTDDSEDETPVDETPVDETPTDETPTDETPVQMRRLQMRRP